MKKNKNYKNLLNIVLLIFIILNCIIVFFIGEIIDNNYYFHKHSVDFENTLDNELDDNNNEISNTTNIDDSSNTSYSKVISIKSDGKVWDEINELDIFKNEDFNYQNIICPGSTGEYKFIVENELDFPVTCNIIFDEINEKNINMVYKIKIDGQYINGNDQWQKIDDIKLENIKIDNNITCSILWRWEHWENDTEIGESDNANYKLNFKIIGVTDGK